VRQDVVRFSRGVARFDKASKEELAGYCRQKVNQVNDTGNSGRGTWPPFGNPFQHFIASGRDLFRSCFIVDTSKTLLTPGKPDMFFPRTPQVRSAFQSGVA
jgi:hypothetical protein